jgi:hypothetical protein
MNYIGCYMYLVLQWIKSFVIGIQIPHKVLKMNNYMKIISYLQMSYVVWLHNKFVWGLYVKSWTPLHAWNLLLFIKMCKEEPHVALNSSKLFDKYSIMLLQFRHINVFWGVSSYMVITFLLALVLLVLQIKFVKK